MVTVYYHPFTRAAGTLWMLEEIGIDHELRFVDLMKGEHKTPEIVALNPMGKLPIVTDGDLVVTESAAIALYLADRYAPGKLAPALDDPARGTYYRWILFAPSVIEPGASGHAAKWEFSESRVGWGNYDTMLSAMETAVADKQFILGDTFSMADVVFGGTLRFMLQFEMIEPRPVFKAYVDRLSERPALQRADARNAKEIADRGLGK